MKLAFTRHLPQLSEVKSVFQRPKLCSLPGARGRFLAYGDENKRAWHTPFECQERDEGLKKTGDESRVFESLFCVPGALDSVTRQDHKSHLFLLMYCLRFPDETWKAEGLIMQHCH